MIYDLIAPIYDKVNGDVDYKEWADFIEKVIERDYKGGKPELVLDLGCGTGRMTLELARRGYDMTGVDYSVEMLDIARENADRVSQASRPGWYPDSRAWTLPTAPCCLQGIDPGLGRVSHFPRWASGRGLCGCPAYSADLLKELLGEEQARG